MQEREHFETFTCKNNWKGGLFWLKDDGSYSDKKNSWVAIRVQAHIVLGHLKPFTSKGYQHLIFFRIKKPRKARKAPKKKLRTLGKASKIVFTFQQGSGSTYESLAKCDFKLEQLSMEIIA